MLEKSKLFSFKIVLQSRKTFRKNQNGLSQSKTFLKVEGYHFNKKKLFREKVAQCRKSSRSFAHLLEKLSHRIYRAKKQSEITLKISTKNLSKTKFLENSFGKNVFDMSHSA